MEEIFVIIFICVLFIGGGYLMFNHYEKHNDQVCNGQVIGREESGQMRYIHKCADGSISIY